MRDCRRTRKFRNMCGRCAWSMRKFWDTYSESRMFGAQILERVLQPYDRCADRTNARIPKGRKDFPGDNDVINQSVVNIHKSIKFRKTADALIMSVLALIRTKYPRIFIDRDQFYFEHVLFIISIFLALSLLYRLYIFRICRNTKRAFFYLFSSTFPQ